MIQLIKACASKLHDSKLQRLGGKEISEDLDALSGRLGLDSREQAVVFTAVFNSSCADRSCDMDDMARYFDCSNLDIVEYIPAVRVLLERGLISVWNSGECNIVSQSFKISPPVLNAILDNRIPTLDEIKVSRPKFDRYDFCKLVDRAVDDDDVSSLGLMQMTSELESSNEDMSFVRNVKAELPELSDRALFYEICYDFYNGDKSDLDSTFRDMYESFGVRFAEKRKLIDGTSALVAKSLAELNDDRDEITLADRGQQILLEGDYSTFGERYDCANRYRFAARVREFFRDRDKYDSDKEGSAIRLARWLRKLEKNNEHLSCVRKIREVIPDIEDRVLFYFACDACPGGMDLKRELRTLFPVNKSWLKLNEFKDEKHSLQQMDLVETCTESTFFGDYTTLVLTDKGKELYFEEDAKIFIEKIDSKDLISSGKIVEKHLYFSEEEQRRLSMVCDSLRQDKYLELVGRLESKGLPKGIAVLLYGPPGTGKTESVMQWAKATGRDIVHVDLSASKSMWYGESEKIVKDIFTRYRNQCKRSKIKPILLFNEADGLFSKRKDISNGSSVDQTENTIQNILLEEMEKLDGILVATTNLADNLDAAFERRFLFKIKLEKPSAEAKRRIWMDRLPSLKEDEAYALSESYSFSGGEIENIVRKVTMKEVLEGQYPDFETIDRLCREEKMDSRMGRAIGF